MEQYYVRLIIQGTRFQMRYYTIKYDKEGCIVQTAASSAGVFEGFAVVCMYV